MGHFRQIDTYFTDALFHLKQAIQFNNYFAEHVLMAVFFFEILYLETFSWDKGQKLTAFYGVIFANVTFCKISLGKFLQIGTYKFCSKFAKFVLQKNFLLKYCFLKLFILCFPLM